VAHDAGLNTIPSLIERSARGKTGRVTGIHVVAAKPLGGDVIDGGTGLSMIAVARQMAGIQGVKIEVEDSHEFPG